MLRTLSAYEFRIAEPLRRKVALIAVAILLAATVDVGGRERSKDWTVLENCRLIVNPANDGDSFHASVGEKEYLFRLYLVDTPEIDALTPARLVEQAKYFGITVPQAIEVGEAGRAFTREKLSQPFTVFTRMSDAMGRSKLERFYAFVQTKDGDLGEQLVRNGLARIYGAKAIPPGFSGLQPERQKLQKFEDEAKQEKIGGWGINVGRLRDRAQKPDAYSFFGPGAKTEPRGTTPATSSPPISATPRRGTSIGTGSPVDSRGSHAKEQTELGKIDINTATEKELRTIPGIGPVTARKIIDARPFRNADDLRKVNGIGDKKYDQIRPYLQ
jgi:competence ComEA-like helix-hairpin-helix protein